MFCSNLAKLAICAALSTTACSAPAFSQELRGVLPLSQSPILSPATNFGAGTAPGSSQVIPSAIPNTRMPELINGTTTGPNVVPDGPLTLSASLNASFAKNPRMYAARTLLGISKAAFAQASILPNPGLYMSNNYGNGYLFGVMLPIEPPWKLAFRLLVAKKEIKQAHLDIERSMWQFRGEVRRAYVELVMAEEIANARNQVRDIASKIQDTAKVRFDTGDAPSLDVRKAKLAFIQARMDAEQSSIQITQAKEQLNLLMGRDAEASVDVPKLPEPGKLVASELLPNLAKPFPQRLNFVQKALQNRLDLRITKQQLVTNHAYLLNAYGNAVPTPRFVVGTLKELNPPTGPIQHNAFFQAYIDLPVFNFNQGDIFRFKATIRQLESQVPSQENQIAAQVSLAYQKVVAARRRIQIYQEEALNESSAISDISQHGYKLGQLTLNSMLDAERSNVQVKSQFLDSVLAYHIAFNELEQAVGVPLDE